MQTQLNDAQTAQTNAVSAIQQQLTEANNNAAALETSLNAILTTAGLSTDGTMTEKLTVLQNKAVEYGKKDGSNPTTPKIDANQTNKYDFIDMEAEHNKLTASILNP